MSSKNTFYDRNFYRNTWSAVQKPENRKIVEALGGENQLGEEDLLEKVEMSENEFYDAAEELEDAGVLDHYDQEHGRGHQTTEMSLFSVFYPAERALGFDNKEEYVEHMLDQDEEKLGRYKGDVE